MITQKRGSHVTPTLAQRATDANGTTGATATAGTARAQTPRHVKTPPPARTQTTADPQPPQSPVDASESSVMQFLRTQLPFSAALACLALFLTVANRPLLSDPWMLSGLSLGFLATVLALILPRARIDARWLILTPILDIVVVALVRQADHGAFTILGILIVFPVIWLAYSFSKRALALAMVAVFAVSASPFALLGAVPNAPIEWARVTLQPLFICLLAFSVWIAATTQRRQEHQLELVTAQLRESLQSTARRAITMDAVINSVPASIVLFDAQHRPVLWNNAARAMSQRADSDVGVPLEGVVPLVFAADRTTQLPLEDQIVARALRGDLLGSELFWVGKAGDQRALIASSRRVADAAGDPLGLVIVARDVTELVESISVRDEFLAAVSHELKTPLTSIVEHLNLLRDEAIDLPRGLDVIHRDTERLLTTVQNLMDAAGQPVLTRLPLEVGAVITAAVQRAREHSQLGDSEIVWDRGEDHRVLADSEALGQVLDHLLGNAMKFAADAPQSRVRVSVGRVDATVVIRVADAGVGMSADEQRQMFDGFYRAPSARTGAIPGAGLGLAIVKSLVEAHGGSVRVKSALGVGTVITVALPAA